MSEKTENSSNVLDMFKWVIIVALLAGVIVANNMLGEVSVLIRAVGAVVAVAIAAFIASTTEKGQAFLTFAKESRIEVRKVVWPTRTEANQTTAIVLIATLVMGLILWCIDGILVNLVNFVMSIGS